MNPQYCCLLMPRVLWSQPTAEQAGGCSSCRLRIFTQLNSVALLVFVTHSYHPTVTLPPN